MCSSSGLLASAHVAQGDTARAAAVLDAAIGWDACGGDLGQRLVWCAQAEVALARGDAAAALGIADRLLHTAMNPREGSGPLRLTSAARRGAGRSGVAGRQGRARGDATRARAKGPALLYGALPRSAEACSTPLPKDVGMRPNAEFAAARAIVQELTAGLDELPARAVHPNARAAIPPPPPPDWQEGVELCLRRADRAGARGRGADRPGQDQPRRLRPHCS